MRKIVAAIVMGFSFIQANAQSFIKKVTDNISGGFKTEVIISSFSLSEMPDATSKINIGGTFGGFVKLDLAEHFALQGDALFHYKTSSFEQGSVKSDYQYWGLEFPIYFMSQLKMNKGERFYVGVGPYVEDGLNAKFKTMGNEIDLYENDEVVDKACMTRLEIGAAAIIGYEFGSGIQVNVGYKTGLTNALEAKKNDASMFPYSVSLGIGYRF